MKERLKVDIEPRKIRIESEPYVKFVGKAFLPIIDIYDVKRKREYFLIISPQSISKPLNALIASNDGKLIHVEIWINKESNEKYSKYQIEIA
jgi:hypothetical protein